MFSCMAIAQTFCIYGICYISADFIGFSFALIPACNIMLLWLLSLLCTATVDIIGVKVVIHVNHCSL